MPKNLQASRQRPSGQNVTPPDPSPPCAGASPSNSPSNCRDAHAANGFSIQGHNEVYNTVGLDQIDHPICCFMADGAYDGEPVYDAVKQHSPDPSPKVVIPPRKTAVLSNEIEEEQTDRDRHILDLKAKGRMAWQKAHDYGRRNLVETTMGRYKSIIGDRLHACHGDAQPVELAIGIKVPNRMTNLAKPVSGKVG